ncbi:hypothetical protein AB8E26_05640 [Stenotrophomonas rhizophila]|uniref:phosphoribosyltransferase-like protein n=1 Tax=Stenotrophomonas rhizophila TaxID=216778 RepID=UPI003515EF75
MAGVISRWETGEPARAQSVISLRRYYEFLSKKLFNEYEPTKTADIQVARDFMRRVDDWLECFSSDSHAISAFRSLEYIMFAGNGEYEELYRCAYRMNIVNWLIEGLPGRMFAENVDTTIKDALLKTWICPASDSLRINEFIKITGIATPREQPDFRTLREFCHEEKIKEYIAERNIERLIVLEDFVGSGRQFKGALEVAMQLFAGPILAVPLIICERGKANLVKYIAESGRANVELSPVMVVPQNCTASKQLTSGEPPSFIKLREAMKDGYDQIGMSLNGKQYGFDGIGSLVVLHSNCPNNVPPIYHAYGGGRWKPVFPRHQRG